MVILLCYVTLYVTGLVAVWAEERSHSWERAVVKSSGYSLSTAAPGLGSGAEWRHMVIGVCMYNCQPGRTRDCGCRVTGDCQDDCCFQGEPGYHMASAVRRGLRRRIAEQARRETVSSGPCRWRRVVTGVIAQLADH